MCSSDLDFYYRIKGITLRVPPLREREGDVLLLAEHFVGQFCRENRRGPLAIPQGTRTLLERYRWPGNVRQLRNALQTATVLSLARKSDALTPDLLPGEITEGTRAAGAPLPGASGLAGRPLEAIEHEAIEATLRAERGNKTRTAKILGIGVRTLYRKIYRYRIDVPENEESGDKRQKPGE